MRRWEEAKRGESRVVLVTGEPGIPWACRPVSMAAGMTVKRPCRTPRSAINILRKLFHLFGRSSKHRDFHAAIVVERHAHRCNRQIMVILKGVCQALGQFARSSVKDVGQARDAFA